MAAKRAKPEPLHPGDERIAREEIEGYYTRQVAQARAELAAAQERFDREQAGADAAITAFRGGERLPELDAWSIELHAGGVAEFHEPVFLGLPIDRAAYDAACARRDATSRWLRSQGYKPINDRRR
jgi:hypothetical protein